MGDYIRLKKNFFNSLEIKRLRNTTNGDIVTIIYLKLLLLADKDGIVYYEGILDNIEEELKEDFNETNYNIYYSLYILKQMKLVETVGYDLKINKVIDTRDRNTKEYKLWRKSVFERDKYTCQDCGACGVKLQAHHKKQWAKYPRERYNVNNGVTLCEKCHKERHKGGNI